MKPPFGPENTEAIAMATIDLRMASSNSLTYLAVLLVPVCTYRVDSEKYGFVTSGGFTDSCETAQPDEDGTITAEPEASTVQVLAIHLSIGTWVYESSGAGAARQNFTRLPTVVYSHTCKCDSLLRARFWLVFASGLVHLCFCCLPYMQCLCSGHHCRLHRSRSIYSADSNDRVCHHSEARRSPGGSKGTANDVDVQECDVRCRQGCNGTYGTNGTNETDGTYGTNETDGKEERSRNGPHGDAFESKASKGHCRCDGIRHAPDRGRYIYLVNAQQRLAVTRVLEIYLFLFGGHSHCHYVVYLRCRHS